VAIRYPTAILNEICVCEYGIGARSPVHGSWKMGRWAGVPTWHHSFILTAPYAVDALFGHTVVLRYRLCGLVVRVLGYRSGGPGSIPGTTRKKSSGSGTGPTQPREYN
jgi:hypothetical protein